VTGEVPTTTGSPKALPAPPPGQPSDPATKPEAGHIPVTRAAPGLSSRRSIVAICSAHGVADAAVARSGTRERARTAAPVRRCNSAPPEGVDPHEERHR
jgi:hypothetical protein